MRFIWLVLLLTVSVNAYEPYLQNRRTAFRKVAAAAGTTVISFDGTDDKITFSGVNPSDDTYSFTAWVRPSSFTDSWGGLMTVGSGNGFYLRSSQLLVCSSSGGSHVSAGTLAAANAWYHIAFVNSAGSWTWYTNGAASGSGTGAGTIGAMNIMGDTPGSDTFHGRIGQAAVFNRALTGTEVGDLYAKTTLPSTIGDLIAYLELDDVANGVSGDAASFVDSSGNGNTGTGDDGANNTGLTGVTADF